MPLLKHAMPLKFQVNLLWLMTPVFVFGFRGAPGIYSARYAGEHGDDAANNAKLLNDLLPFRKMVKRLKVCLCAYLL